jgi:hypothetical protein
MTNDRIFGGFLNTDIASQEFDLQNPYQVVDKTSGGEHAINATMSTAGMAATGASVGSAFGPPGTVIGGLVGAGLGLGKGIADIFVTSNNEKDMSKRAEKYNADLQALKSSTMMAMNNANSMKTTMAMEQLNKQNLNSYFNDIDNDYAL